MMSNYESLFIKIYEKIVINVQISNKLRIIILINVAYVSNFMINLVTDSILTNKNLYFDI